MQRFFILIVLFLSAACDPWGFGFKKNPAFVLKAAHEAAMTGDFEAFQEVTGREALCLYGTSQGLEYLRGHLQIRNPDQITIVPKLIDNSAHYNGVPQFVGYWSYFQERYKVQVLDKQSKEDLLSVIVECHYGMEGAKDEQFQNLKIKKYKKKECRLIKILPKTFEQLPMNEDCDFLKVPL